MRQDFAKSRKAMQDVNECVTFEFFLNPSFSFSHMLDEDCPGSEGGPVRVSRQFQIGLALRGNFYRLSLK